MPSRRWPSDSIEQVNPIELRELLPEGIYPGCLRCDSELDPLILLREDGEPVAIRYVCSKDGSLHVWAVGDEILYYEGEVRRVEPPTFEEKGGRDE